MSQDKKDTKEKILQAARKLFVQKGFNGASMASIRDEAGVNHALLFYYFKNKENLWEAVKNSIVSDSKIYDKILPKGNLNATEFIRSFVENFAQFNSDNPDMLSILNWQRLETDSIKVGDSESFKTWIDAFKKYQDKGEIREDIMVEFIIYSILSMLSSAAMDDCTFIENQKAEQKFVDFVAETATKISLL